MPVIVAYHGSKSEISSFDPATTSDGGVHFSETTEQAMMRNSDFLYTVEIHVPKLKKARDTGDGWKHKISRARQQGYDDIIYLNRYEGIPAHRIEALEKNGLLGKLDEMSDRDFLRHVPEAGLSYIVFDQAAIKIVDMKTKASKEYCAP